MSTVHNGVQGVTTKPHKVPDIEVQHEDDFIRSIQLSSTESLHEQIQQMKTEPDKFKELTRLSIEFPISKNELKLFIATLSSLGEIRLKSLEMQYGCDKLTKKIGQLNNLELLTINSSTLKSLPKEIGQLKKLQELTLHLPELATVPEEMKNVGGMYNSLSSLVQKVELHSSKLKKLPLAVWLAIKEVKALNINAKLLAVKPEVLERLKERKNIIFKSKDLNLPRRDYEYEAYIEQEMELSFENS